MDSPMMNFENRPTDAALTPKAQKEFEKIFCQWMDEEWNQERLLLGGTGNLVTLAARLVAYLADPEDKNYSRRLNSKRAAMHMHSSSEKEGGDGTTLQRCREETDIDRWSRIHSEIYRRAKPL